MKRISKGRILGASLVLLGIWFVTALLSLNVGSVPIPVRTSLRLLGGFFLGDNSGGDPLASVLFSVRLPRILLGSLVGAALATAGAAFQALLRNPLADPYVLGVSTGASMGTILYSIFAGWLGFAAAGGGMIYARPLAAFLGAVFTVWAVYVIAGSSYRASESSQRLLLAGIVLASFLSSINVFLLTSTSKADIRGIFYWLIGDLSRPVDASIYPVTALVFGGFFLIYLFSQSLNLIGMGETDAMVLGVEVKRIRTCVYVIASLITGAVVSVSGPIAYIGLICPHMGRMMFGSDNRILFPTVFLFGAIFTLSADTVARTVLSPTELPVGIVTAVCGAPLFIYLLHRRGGGTQ
jgi:iron complex transport system permease protein